jgi:hypothetical protein
MLSELKVERWMLNVAVTNKVVIQGGLAPKAFGGDAK